MISKETATPLHRAVIGLGSNIEPQHNIPQALDVLTKLGRVAGVSRLRRTKPIGGLPQPDYQNGVAVLLTDLEPKPLKEKLRAIEDALGRDRNAPAYGPRTIDLDLLVYDDTLYNKDLLERSFIQEALDELDPNWRERLKTSVSNDMLKQNDHHPIKHDV